MSTFNLHTFLTENRDAVIAKHTKLSTEQFYSGITIKAFMVQVMNGMQRNAPRNEKQAMETLDNVMGMIYMENVKIGVVYSRPYSESNHAKQVNYHGAQKSAMLNNI